MAWLVCTAGDDKGVSVELKDQPLVLGRGDECDIRVVQSCVSHRHCELRLQKGKLIVEDLDSHNGMKYKGKRYKGKILKLSPNEHFEIGNDVFEFADSYDK